MKRGGPLPPLLLAVLLAGCGGESTTVAPVTDYSQGGKGRAPRPAGGEYVVAAGDTLHSIAFERGLNWRELAEWNGIRAPYVIRKGDRLRLSAPSAVRNPVAPGPGVKVRAIDAAPLQEEQVGPAAAPSPRPGAPAAPPRPAPPVAGGASTGAAAPAASAAAPPPAGGPAWRWPTEGAVTRGFAVEDTGNKGVDIAGQPGQPVTAAAAGEVVYSGSGLNRYGKLIIVKHDERYLSAYAHNRELLVKEGDKVQAGQTIAELGDTGTDHPMLHFEIRVDGKPVDPMRYLPRR